MVRRGALVADDSLPGIASDGSTRLRDAGLRVTMPRLAVMGLIESSDDHLSADAVRTGLADTGIALQRSSVFNVLATLAAAGLIHRVELGGPSRFERNGAAHDHFRCDSCGAIENVSETKVPPPPVHGQVYTTVVVHRGLCHNCLRAGVRPDGRPSGP